MADLQLKGITKFYGDQKIIDELDLEVRSGEFVTLLGPSGCGKTTILRMIAGLESIENGELRVGGKRYNDIPSQKRRIAMVFQSYALFPHMTVEGNILFGLRIRRAPHHEMFDKLSWVVPMLGLDGLEKRLPKEISGGQRQRVALARAIVLDPDVLLLDEPLSNLDAALRDMAMEELKRIHRQVGKTIVYVTHNQLEAMTMSERIAILNRGRLEQYDTPSLVYDLPRTSFAAEFIGSPAMNMLDGEICEEQGCVGVRTECGFLLMDKDRSQASQGVLGKRVHVGIRPQNILHTGHGAGRRSSDTRIPLTVELVENLGDRSLVVGRSTEGTIIRLVVTRDEEISVDSRIEAFVDGRRIHVFDTNTGQNLFK